MLLEIFGGKGKQWSDQFLTLALPLHDTHSVTAKSAKKGLDTYDVCSWQMKVCQYLVDSGGTFP